MPTFCCTYAYDVPHYADFVVEAPNAKAALRQCQRSLRAGRFADVIGEEYGDTSNERVFVLGQDRGSKQSQYRSALPLDEVAPKPQRPPRAKRRR